MSHNSNNLPARKSDGAVTGTRTAAQPVLGVAALADRFPISAAATRFLSRPEIEDSFWMGTSGLSYRMPTTPERRLALYRSLPQPVASLQMAQLIEDALASPAAPDDASLAIRAIIAGWQRLDPAVASIAVPVLIEEVVARRWPMAAIVGGLLSLLKTQTFPPAVAEMIEAIHEERLRLNKARMIAETAAEVFVALEARLIGDGQIDWED